MAPLDQLSTRERAVVELLLKAQSNKQIASALGISIRTVEFHLKNIYTKFQVGSRIELILKLGNTTGGAVNEGLGYSAVERLGETAENRGKLSSPANWAIDSTKELDMHTLSSMRLGLVELVTAIFTGFAWIALFTYYGNLTVHGTKAWAIPLITILIVIGVSVGLIGKRNASSLRKVFFSVLLGTSLRLFSIIPLMLIVVLPLEKLIVKLGLPDPFGSTIMASDVSNLVGTITMIVTWLVTGTAIGTALLFVSTSRAESTHHQSLKSV